MIQYMIRAIQTARIFSVAQIAAGSEWITRRVLKSVLNFKAVSEVFLMSIVRLQLRYAE